MCDLLKKNGINIDVKALSKKLGCPIIETSALKKTGLKEVIAEAIKVAKSHAAGTVSAIFESSVEDKVSAIEAELPSSIPDAEKRWYAIKVLENDSKVAEQLGAITVNGSECDVVEKVKELTGGKGPECIFDAAGHWTVSEQAVQMVAKGGRIGITGLPAKPSSIPMTDIAMRQISIIGNRAYERKHWRQALSLLANGLDISMISNMVIPLKDWRKGMEFIESGEGLRVVLEP